MTGVVRCTLDAVGSDAGPPSPRAVMTRSLLLLLITGSLAAQTAERGDIIINELYWHNTAGGEDHFEAVELLVLRDLDLHQLVLTDAHRWQTPKLGKGEHRLELDDAGTGALRHVRAGTLVVIYDGAGSDDLDGSDHVLKIYAHTSPHARMGSTGHAFRLVDKGDHLHVGQGDEHLHMVRYRAQEYRDMRGGDPGTLPWGNGCVDVGPYRLNAGSRFVEDSWREANKPKHYQSYQLTYPVVDNLGWPNGGDNTEWIAELRGQPAESLAAQIPVHRTAADLVTFDAILLQCHRGAGHARPENTQAAFDFSWERGAVPEVDVRRTRDGVLVAFHDETFARLVEGATGKLARSGVEDLDYQAVAKLDVGAWMGRRFRGMRIPRLDDVLAQLRERPERALFLDIKSADLAELAELVRSQAVEGQVILASQHHEQLRRWAELLPGARCMLWMGGTQQDMEKKLARLREDGFQGLTRLQCIVRVDRAQPDPFAPSSVFLARTAKEMRARGLAFQVIPWEIAEEEVEAAFHRFCALGITAFATDHLEATQEALADWFQRNGD